MKHFNIKTIYLNEVDSTNNYANRLIATDCVKTNTVILAKRQSAGKGQLNNIWQSAHGKNLLFSLILQPAFLPPEQQFVLSKAISIAIAQYLSDFTCDVFIKWPNDIYINNKKIAGILIETSIRGNLMDYCIIGAGINLNQTNFDSNLPNPVSLQQITGKQIDIENAMTTILSNFYQWYNLLKENSAHQIDAAYFNRLYRKTGWHQYKKANTFFEARIIGIGEYGHLILQKRDNTTAHYAFKEIEFII